MRKTHASFVSKLVAVDVDFRRFPPVVVGFLERVHHLSRGARLRRRCLRVSLRLLPATTCRSASLPLRRRHRDFSLDYTLKRENSSQSQLSVQADAHAVSALKLLKSGAVSPPPAMCTSPDTFRHHPKNTISKFQAFDPLSAFLLAPHFYFWINYIHLLTYHAKLDNDGRSLCDGRIVCVQRWKRDPNAGNDRVVTLSVEVSEFEYMPRCQFRAATWRVTLNTHRVKWRNKIYGHDMIAILWV